MIGPGANLMPIPAAVAGALNVGYASGADLEYLFAERGSLVAAAGNALISCTRSGATATCFNRSGQLETVPANTPRLNFDPATLRYENMFTYAREFDNAAWIKSAATISLNAWTAPDGLTVADKLVESATNSSHECHQGVTTVSGVAHTFQVKVRAAERTQCYLEIYGAATIYRVVFSLSTGAMVAQTGSGSHVAGIDKGDGWWLFSITATSTGTTTFGFVGTASGGASSYLGDGTSGIYILDAQMNTGSTALAFSNTLAAAKAKEYACKGLLVEESRVNLESYSADYSNAIYTKVGLNAVTTNNAGAPDGTATFNKLPEDSSTGLHTAVRNVTVVAGSTYTVSRFFKAAENLLVQLLFDDTATANGVYANFNVSAGTITKAIAAFGTGTAVTAGIESCGNGIYRAYIVGTAGTVATTARVAVTLINSGTATQFPSYTGVSGNGLYVWGSQSELGAFMTSHIPTTSAAVTRNADAITVGGVSQWFNATEGTVVCVSSMADDTAATFPRQWVLSDGTAAQATHIYSASASNILAGEVNNVSNTFTGVNSFSSYTGARTKLALAYKANDTAIAKDGVCNATDTSVTLPTGVNKLTLGADFNHNNGSFLNGHIERWAYWRTRETNTYLAALTA